MRGSDNTFLKSPPEHNWHSRAGALLLSDFAAEGSSLKTRWAKRKNYNNLLDQIVWVSHESLSE